MTKLTGKQISDERLAGWTQLLDGLQTRIATPDFATGLALVNTIGAAAEELDHHPDVDLRYTTVAVRLTSHDVRGITSRDIALARRIDALAAEAGLTTDRSAASRLELALDTPAQDRVTDFWAAVLGTEHTSAAPPVGDEVRDRTGLLPTVWFQHSGDEAARQRWHLDLWVDHAQVQPRIDAALAAGGTLVSEAEAPAFWVLADAEGNRMCLCTSVSRP